MFNKADIIARLQDGDTMDEIVAEITDTINAAETEYKALQEAAEKEKSEAARVEKLKEEAIYMILDGLSDYLIASGEDEFQKEIVSMDVAQIAEMLDSSIALAKQMEKLKEVEFKLPFFFN